MAWTMVYVVCAYEIWLSVLDSSFVTQLGKIAGVWDMEYGGMAVLGMQIYI